MSSPPTLGNMLPLGPDASTPPAASKKKKPGRTPSLIWQLLTDEPDPQRRNSTTCKHCKQPVAYYKKSEQAIRHLKKCARFQEMQHQFTFMNQFSDVLPLYNQKLSAKVPTPKRAKTDQTQAQRAQMEALQMQQATGALSSALDQAAAHHAQVMNQIAMQQSIPESLMDPTTMSMSLKDDAKEKESKDRKNKNGPLSKTQNDRFEEELAMHVYVTGMAFDALEESHLARAMTILRPNLKLPDKKTLENDLMVRCYEKMHKQVWGYLSTSPVRACLKRDAWSNMNLYHTNDPEETYVTYMAVNNEKRFFLESEKAEGEESQYNSIMIAQDLKRMMQPIVSNISGVVTGSTEYHSRAWDMLKAEYPTKFFYGCICHALHLAIMDIFGPEKSLENDPRRLMPQMHMDFPFQDLVELTNNCNELLSFFSSYQYAAKFKMFDSQLLHTMKGFTNASSTMAWGTLAARFRVLMQSEDILQSIASDPDFLNESPTNQRAVRTSIKEFVLNLNWKLTLEKAITILTPIELILYKFQDDRAPISEVYFESKHLLTDFDAVFGLTTVELEYIKKVVTERWQYVLSEAHGLAFLLDPRYIGKSMTRDYREQIEELIFNFPETDQDMGVNEDRRRAMTEEYTEYVMYAKNQRNNRTYKWEMLEKGNRSPLQFWQSEADDWPHLKSLALTLFSLAPSSVASEKTLCKSTLTQSSRRNKLSFDDMRRLAFICINDSQFTGNRVTGEVQSNALPDFTMGDTALSPDGMMMWMI
ncbi:hAT family C-terminal dimerization region [Phytophthora infestans]|uniref:HAT family C-terminal dimerization region n=1 Tax=Phytophthora infestans TaxID=4787 RepID=A0A8S9U5H2_PHYIN|nr:hAT family C-terminal dimerization region [Phytophthora infestans]